MKKEVIVIIAVCIVVAIITAFITTNLTGNVVNIGWWNKKQVYTVDEVNELIENLNTGGETPVHYTKSEIDNLLKTLSQNRTIVIDNNDIYTKIEVDNKINSISEGATDQEVLNMLNSCEIVRTSLGVCDPICNEKEKTCIFGDAVFQVQLNAESLVISQVVACQEEDVQSLSDMYIQAGYIVQDVDTSCVCCSA